MIKITGLDKLTRNLDEIREATAALDGELGTVRFDPSDPASIEAAIQEVESIVDNRAGAYGSNPTVSSIMENMKERYRDAILEKAAAARLQGEQD